ncbi:hypothetical protein AB6A40_001154 [Gnathostoma spinigerum]|uniref:Uncharacterized protein n=1 Tax=Gnathostoma spinigerum TaxID=75299 RepID=A0ABD6EDQ2_9BILA
MTLKQSDFTRIEPSLRKFLLAHDIIKQHGRGGCRQVDHRKLAELPISTLDRLMKFDLRRLPALTRYVLGTIYNKKMTESTNESVKHSVRWRTRVVIFINASALEGISKNDLKLLMGEGILQKMPTGHLYMMDIHKLKKAEKIARGGNLLAAGQSMYLPTILLALLNRYAFMDASNQKLPAIMEITGKKYLQLPISLQSLLLKTRIFKKNMESGTYVLEPSRLFFMNLDDKTQLLKENLKLIMPLPAILPLYLTEDRLNPIITLNTSTETQKPSPVVINEKQYYALLPSVRKIIDENNLFKKNMRTNQYELIPLRVFKLSPSELEKLRNQDLSNVPQLKEFIFKLPMYNPVQPGMPGSPGFNLPRFGKGQPHPQIFYLPPVVLSKRQYSGLPITVRKIVDGNNLFERNPRTNQYKIIPMRVFRLPPSELEKLRNQDLSNVPQLKELIFKLPMYSPVQPGMPGSPGFNLPRFGKRQPNPQIFYLQPVVINEEQYYALPPPVRKIVDENNLFKKNPRTNQYELIPLRVFRLPPSELEKLRNEDLSNVPQLKELIFKLPMYSPVQPGMPGSPGFNLPRFGKGQPNPQIFYLQPVVINEEQYYALPPPVRKIVDENNLFKKNPRTNQYELIPHRVFGLPPSELEKLRNEDLSNVPQLKEFIFKLPIYNPVQPGMPGSPGFNLPRFGKGQPHPQIFYLPPVVLNKRQYSGLPITVRKIVDGNNLFERNPRTNQYKIIPMRVFRLSPSELEKLRNQDLSNVPQLKELIFKLPMYNPVQPGMLGSVLPRYRMPTLPPVVLRLKEYTGLPPPVRSIVDLNNLFRKNPKRNEYELVPSKIFRLPRDDIEKLRKQDLSNAPRFKEFVGQLPMYSCRQHGIGCCRRSRTGCCKSGCTGRRRRCRTGCCRRNRIGPVASTLSLPGRWRTRHQSTVRSPRSRLRRPALVGAGKLLLMISCGSIFRQY